MKILNPQHNRNQLSEGSGSKNGQTSHLSAINQQILERLKEQQQLRIAQKRQAEQDRLYQSESGVQGDLQPASGQYINNPSSDMKHQSYRTLNQSKTLLQQSQSQHQFNTNQLHHPSQNQTFTSNDMTEQQLLQNQQQQQQLQQQDSDEQQQIEKDHLLVMTIDLGEGNCDILHVYESDIPIEKAEAFCRKNGLTKEAMDILAKNIEVNKDIVLRERQHQLYHSTSHLRNNNNGYYNNNNNNNNGVITQSADNYYSSTAAIRNNYYQNYSKSMNSTQQQQQGQQQNLMHQIQPQQLFESIEQQNDLYHPDYYSNQIQSNQDQNEEDQIQQQQLQQGQQQQQQQQHQRSRQQSQQGQNDDYQVIHPSSKKNIFERLHGEAACKQQRIEQKKKEQLAQEQSMHLNSTYRSTKRTIGDTVVNLGDYLYYKGEELKENKKKNIEELVLQKKMEQEKELSFKPEIDRNSAKICYYKRMENNEKTEDLLIKQGQLYKEKKDIKKSERENQQLEGCTFKPEVNIMSQFLYEMKKKEQDFPNEGKFDQLHKEYIKRHQRQEERELYTNECTFHPKINRPPKTLENLPFVDRMMKSATEKEKKVQELKIKQQLEQQQEYESTFKPVTGRAPQFRNTNNLPVHEYLYQKKEEKKIKQEILTKVEMEKQQQQQAISLEKSNQIVDNKQKTRLLELFCALDSDGDGEISTQNIDISSIPQQILLIISPLLCEMDANNFTFNFESFLFNSLKLISKLTIAEKNELFNSQKGKWDEKKAQYDNYSYAPTINHRSQQLARKRSYEKFEGVYNHGLHLNQQKQDKLNHMKQELAQRELDECSFKPQLFKPMNIYSFTDPKNAEYENNFFGIQQNGFDLGDGQFRVTGIVNNAPTVNSIQQ